MQLRFEWDEEKDWANFLKHGLTFEEAKEIWADPMAIEVFDEDHSEKEVRYLRVGLSAKGILVVSFCEKNDTLIRIISAGKATARERKFYEG